ncbi:MAG: twitching motility protein PilT [Deltaproteobacteria bacterium RBG_16_49_23]|nr:MAG: twitching motility protein PilT [Deltaproteobacteria bacterium RBG_16_49_23]
MNGDKIFVDTNVLVYAHDVDASQKHQIAQRLLSDLWNKRAGVLSVQVLQEFYVTITRKLIHPLTAREARNIIRNYLTWHIEINDSLSVLNASRIEENYKLSFWDALIVAAASRAKVTKVQTEDLKSGQVIEGILIENPFLKST